MLSETLRHVTLCNEPRAHPDRLRSADKIPRSPANGYLCSHHIPLCPIQAADNILIQFKCS